jgi:hypothetical protein
MANGEDKYKDIIDMPHHVSGTRPHMSIADRAAQFAPFKAMVGLDEEMTETARITEEKLEISPDEVENLNAALAELKDDIRQMPKVKIIYFCLDYKKQGGEYVTYVGNVKRIDEGDKKIIFTDGTTVKMTDLYELVILK